MPRLPRLLGLLGPRSGAARAFEWLPALAEPVSEGSQAPLPRDSLLAGLRVGQARAWVLRRMLGAATADQVAEAAAQAVTRGAPAIERTLRREVPGLSDQDVSSALYALGAVASRAASVQALLEGTLSPAEALRESGAAALLERAPRLAAAMLLLVVVSRGRFLPGELPEASREVGEVVELLARCGYGWEELLALFGTREQVARLVAFRRAVVDEVSQALQEKDPGVRFEATGSAHDFPPSDLDVTVFAVSPQGSVADALAGFHRDMVARFGASSAAVLDANLYDQIPSLARRSDAELPAQVQDRLAEELGPQLEELALAVSYGKAARYLGAERWQELGARLRQAHAAAGLDEQGLRRRLLEAEETELAVVDRVSYRAGQLRAAAPGLSPLDPDRADERYAALAREELYVSTLGEVQAAVQAQMVEEYQRLPEGRERERSWFLVECVEHQAWEQLGRARAYAHEAYESWATIDLVVGRWQRVWERAGVRPLPPPTSVRLLCAVNEHLGDIEKELGRHEAHGLVEAARRSSKYAHRFLQAALPLAQPGTPLAERLQRLAAAHDELLGFRRDPAFGAEPSKAERARQLLAEVGVGSLPEYRELWLALDVELHLCVGEVRRP